MAKNRKICVVTGTRAEYGLLRWLIQEIEDCLETDLQLVVTGTHLESRFGETYRVIEEDGFRIDVKIPLFLDNDGDDQIIKSVATALEGFSAAFQQLRPDLVVFLGDRYEILAAAQTALFLKIPTAHIHGGERTEGAIDEAIRHSITKMSHLHFASCEEYRNRIIQLGEQPDNVWNTGSIALDNFKNLKLVTKNELLEEFHLESNKHLFLCTMHPETLLHKSIEKFIEPLLDVLSDLKNTNIIFTLGNADAGGQRLNSIVEEFGRQHTSNVHVTKSLGQLRYLSALQAADLVIGNSSSGIVEAPSAGTVVVNIGDRQLGRLRSPCIIDVANEAEEIRKGIIRGLNSEMQTIAEKKVSPFGIPGASKKIFEIISQIPLEHLIVKNFYDLKKFDN